MLNQFFYLRDDSVSKKEQLCFPHLLTMSLIIFVSTIYQYGYSHRVLAYIAPFQDRSNIQNLKQHRGVLKITCFSVHANCNTFPGQSISYSPTKYFVILIHYLHFLLTRQSYETLGICKPYVFLQYAICLLPKFTLKR